MKTKKPASAGNSGGEGGIRTLGTALQPYSGLANRRTRPLCDLSITNPF